MNDLNDSHARRSLPPIKTSHQLSTIIENPLHDSSDNSDDPPNTPKNFFWYYLITTVLYKTSKTNSMVTRFKVFRKRIIFFNQSTNIDNTTHITSTLPTSKLPLYSTLNSNPNDYPLNIPTVENDSESPVKVYSKTNYAFPPPSF